MTPAPDLKGLFKDFPPDFLDQGQDALQTYGKDWTKEFPQVARAISRGTRGRKP